MCEGHKGITQNDGFGFVSSSVLLDYKTQGELVGGEAGEYPRD